MSTVVQLKKKKEKLNPNAAWEFAIKKQSEKRGKTPKIEKGDAQAKAADQVNETKIAFQDAETAFKLASQNLIENFIQPEYAKRAVKGAFSKSFNVPGLNTSGVQVVYQDRFTPISRKSIEDFQSIERAIGDHIGCFEKQIQVKLRDPSPESFAKLAALLGERLHEMFDITPSLAPIKGMDQRQWQLPDQVKSYLHQYSPSIRLLHGGKSEE